MLKRFACITLFVSACASTPLQATWRNPKVGATKLAGKKVLGLFININKKPALRRSAEDTLARELTAWGAQGAAAYTVLDETELRDRDAARRKLESLRFAAVVVMRIVGGESQRPGDPRSSWTDAAHRHFWDGTWGLGWASVDDPGDLAADRTVSVEALVYSFDRDDLVWAGSSRTITPTGIDRFVVDVARAVTKQMAKDGLLPNDDDDWGSRIGSDIGLGR